MLVYQRVNMNKHKQPYTIMSPKHDAKCVKTSLKPSNWSIIKIVLLLCCRLLFMVSIPHSRSSSDPPTAIETPRWCKTKSSHTPQFCSKYLLIWSVPGVGSSWHEISVNVMHNGALAYWRVATACP